MLIGTSAPLQDNGVEMIIRGHEPPSLGIGHSHGRVLTTFAVGNYGGRSNAGEI